MAERSVITPHEFADKFRDAIRVGFNWDRFFDEAWEVEAVTLDSREALGRCFMPWYIGKGGEEVAYDHQEAVPMSLADVPKAKPILNDERQKDVEDYVKEFKSQQEAIEFTAPTYALPDDCYFVLDRNHRLSALAISSVPFRVTLWNVRGPLDQECLLDLLHWQQSS
jgi:hypothetical protein